MWRNNPISFLTVKQCLNIAINIKYETKFTNIFLPSISTTCISKINSMTSGNL